MKGSVKLSPVANCLRLDETFYTRVEPGGARKEERNMLRQELKAWTSVSEQSAVKLFEN